MLLEKKWIIASVIAFTLLLSLVYVTLATPVYRANFLLQIEDSAPASKSFLSDTTGLGEIKTTAAGEMQVIGSRTVLGAAVDKAHLQITASPRYAPIVGAWFARRAKELSNPGIFGLGGYVSGTETIKIERFEVTPSFEDSDPFIVTALGENRFTIDHKLFENPLDGIVGELLEAKFPDGVLRIKIKELTGKPSSEFTISVASRLARDRRQPMRKC